MKAQQTSALVPMAIENPLFEEERASAIDQNGPLQDLSADFATSAVRISDLFGHTSNAKKVFGR